MGGLVSNKSPDRYDLSSSSSLGLGCAFSVSQRVLFLEKTLKEVLNEFSFPSWADEIVGGRDIHALPLDPVFFHIFPCAPQMTNSRD